MKVRLAVISSFLLSMVLTAHPSLAAGGYDALTTTQITVPGSNPEGVLDRTIDDLRAVFQRYKPAVDSTTKITRPLRVGGSARNPTIQVSARKCVVVVCQDVDLNASISLQPTKGKCLRNFVMSANLAGSSEGLTKVYDRIDISICFNHPSGSAATLGLSAAAHRASTYRAGTVQQEILNYIKLQIGPITRALNEELASNAK